MKIDLDILQKAADLIKKGDLVAFPTETVYGLGANALNSSAVKKIFQAKGRPSDNPLIVHIADLKDLGKLAKNIPKEAYILAEKFWPGPLTFVLERQEIVPDEVTGGLNSVAVRFPKNEIAQTLIKLSQCPIAAPSANKSGRPSPTDAESVYDDFAEEILIIDGGDCEYGVESTVIDLTSKPFTILRAGGVTKEELEEVLKEKVDFASHTESKPKSPGMKYKHYAPKGELVLVRGRPLCPSDISPWEGENLVALIQKYKSEGKKVGVLCVTENMDLYQNADLLLDLGSINDLKTVASNVFRKLREFDKNGIDVILSESFDEKGIGLAIMDKLVRAASKII